MSNIFYAIGDFFSIIFNGVEALGNSVNYIYIGVIFVFLVVWTFKMIKHRKDGEEHASS
tara:strand:- start:3195 stop:3371 length:177 start_codon:yes stop_codon:yes gene_type:complete